LNGFKCDIVLLIATLLVGTISLPRLGLAQIQDVDGWDRARWGMSEDELIKAFEGQIVKLPETSRNNRMYSDLGIDDLEIRGSRYQIRFYMDNRTNVLIQVSIAPKQGTASVALFKSLEHMLVEEYGNPSYKDNEKGKKMERHRREWSFRRTVIELVYLDTRIGAPFLVLVYHRN
jgi:hypothetical protein